MKLLHVIDSLEINGGSVMCFEMASAMRKHFTGDNIDCLVVSKTGKYGRKRFLADRIADDYGFEIPSVNYQTFHQQSEKYRDWVILQHRLECTRPLKFKNKPRLYLIVNHTVQKLHRLQKFQKADLIVSVCKYLRDRSPHLSTRHKVILNGIEKNLEKPFISSGFTTGRCHRLPSVKMSIDSLRFLDSLKIPNHTHYLAGPDHKGVLSYEKKHSNTCLRYLRKLDDQEKKRKLIRSFDVYFYDTYGPEGASVAILEGLAAGVPVLCKPLGGNKELVRNGVNGFHYNDFKQARNILLDLSRNPKKLEALKKSVSDDFDTRLSVKRCVLEYRKLIEKWMRK